MTAKEYGEVFGFLIMFFLSTVILYLVLGFLGKMPESWSYLHILNLVFAIVLVGIIVNKVLN